MMLRQGHVDRIVRIVSYLGIRVVYLMPADNSIGLKTR